MTTTAESDWSVALRQAGYYYDVGMDCWMKDRQILGTHSTLFELFRVVGLTVQLTENTHHLPDNMKEMGKRALDAAIVPGDSARITVVTCGRSDEELEHFLSGAVLMALTKSLNDGRTVVIEPQKEE